MVKQRNGGNQVQNGEENERIPLFVTAICRIVHRRVLYEKSLRLATGWRITFVESAQHPTVRRKRVNREREVVVCAFSLRAINITSKISLSFELSLPRIT